MRATGNWTIEQGQFTKLELGDMQTANTTWLLYLVSLKFTGREGVWKGADPCVSDQDLVNGNLKTLDRRRIRCFSLSEGRYRASCPLG